MIRDYLKLAVNSLAHRKTRSWLTLIGIFIGIAAVVALISLGQGLHEAITGEFLKLGADKIQVTPKSTGFQSSAEVKNQLRERDLRVVERTNGVLHATGYNMHGARVTWGKDNVVYGSMVIGSDDDPVKRQVVVDFFTMKFGEGRDIKQGESKKALVGYDLVNPDKQATPMKIGDKIKVNGTTFEVVGNYQKMGDPVVDSAVFVTLSDYNDIFGSKDKYDAIVVQTQPGIDADMVADDLTQALRRERGLKEGDEDFEVQTPEELIASFDKIFGIVNVVLVGIAAISLVVGGIGIMNTMYTSVLERTKEIGIMKAIGATNHTIMLIFLLESGLLGLVGGIIGVIFGLGLAKATEYIGKTVLDTTLLSAWWSWWLILGALAFAFFTGVISGVAPAYRASKQPAVESLRYE